MTERTITFRDVGRRVVIPANSTPSEKERGHWVKLTDRELNTVLAWLTGDDDPALDSLYKKLLELRDAA